MSDLIAFGLREEYVGTVTLGDGAEAVTSPVFLGGVIAAGDRDIDVRQELDANGGTITLHATDPAVGTLDEYPPLKRVSVPEGATAPNPWEDLPAATLRNEASARGLAKGGSKAELADRIFAAEQHGQDQPPQPGDNPPPADPITDTNPEGQAS